MCVCVCVCVWYEVYDYPIVLIPFIDKVILSPFKYFGSLLKVNRLHHNGSISVPLLYIRGQTTMAQGQICPTTCFVNKVLPGTQSSLFISLKIVCDCFHATKAELKQITKPKIFTI